jgi:hypothetical protein
MKKFVHLKMYLSQSYQGSTMKRVSVRSIYVSLIGITRTAADIFQFLPHQTEKQ